MRRIFKVLGVMAIIPLLCVAIVACVPTIPLTLEATSPAEGAELTVTPVTVGGSVSNAEAEVTINEVAVTVAEDGTFSGEVELTEGENTITVVATLGEEIVTQTVTVTYTPPPPPLTLEVRSPAEGAELTVTPVTVEGSVSDAEAEVTINEVAVTVAEDGTFSGEVELTEGENTITVVATLGEEIVTQTVTVTYTLPAE